MRVTELQCKKCGIKADRYSELGNWILYFDCELSNIKETDDCNIIVMEKALR